MNLLFQIVYAAHANGTHHKLALDALRYIKCMDADLWQRLFLAHAKLYLEGSKAPDNEFKDFKNHVLHTRDNYWGGAPDKVTSWYHHLVEALSQQDWPTAVYCAGVLSHYYTDPLQPFHTAQSEAENNIHRAAEWSISKAYDELWAQGERDFTSMTVDMPRDANWLVQLLCRGAERANGNYEKLIAHYDIQRGVSDPPAGLDRVARRVLAELIRYAALSYAAVLDRAIEASNVHAPEVSLTAKTLLAAVQVPIKMVAKRIADAETRAQVQRMYDELVATGTVEKNLPDDDRQVRDLHAKEVLAAKPAPPPVSKVFPLKPRPPRVLTRIEQQRAERAKAEATASGASNVVSFAKPAAAAAAAPVQVPAPARSAEPIPLRAAAPPPPPAPTPDVVEEDSIADVMERTSTRPRAGLTARLGQVEAPAKDTEPAPPRKAAEASTSRKTAEPAAPRFYLTPDQDVVDGPTIGPKTAERLYPHGIRTVGDLLQADPAMLAAKLDARHISAETIVAWQDQARMVCDVPGLRGSHAQLLVGAGYRSADAIAEAEPDALCADVLAFAASPVGQRLLRNGDPPDIEKIKGWLEAARSVKAA